MTFTDALTRANIVYRTGHNPSEINLCCLFCQDRGESLDTRFRLGVNTHTGAGHCFNCDWKSKNSAPFWILKRLRINTVGVSIRVPQNDTATAKEFPQLPDDFTLLSRPVENLDKLARAYVLRRGVTPDQIRRHHIGASYTGRYCYRIVFPIYDGHHRDYRTLRGIVARDFTGRKEPRYLNSGGDKWLWGFEPGKPVTVLSEGIFKALRIEQVVPRIYGSASLLGHALSDVQLDQLLKSRARRVILYPDPDAAGRRGVIAVADRLADEWKREVYVVHPVLHPADIENLDVIKKQIAEAVPYRWAMRQRLRLV